MLWSANSYSVTLKTGKLWVSSSLESNPTRKNQILIFEIPIRKTLILRPQFYRSRCQFSKKINYLENITLIPLLHYQLSRRHKYISFTTTTWEHETIRAPSFCKISWSQSIILESGTEWVHFFRSQFLFCANWNRSNSRLLSVSRIHLKATNGPRKHKALINKLHYLTNTRYRWSMNHNKEKLWSEMEITFMPYYFTNCSQCALYSHQPANFTIIDKSRISIIHWTWNTCYCQ
jgi:hypothetical protein